MILRYLSGTKTVGALDRGDKRGEEVGDSILVKGLNTRCRNKLWGKYT